MKKTMTLCLLFALAVFLNGCGKKETAETKNEGNKTPDKKEQVTEKSNEPEVNDNSSFHIVYKMKADKDVTIELWTKGVKARSQTKSEISGITMNAIAYFPGDGYVYTVTDVGKQKMALKMKATDSGAGNGDMSTAMFKAKEHLKDFEKSGEGEVIGYKCNVYKDKEGNKYYFYKDYVMLKFEGKGVTMEAEKLENNSGADDKMFEVPADVKFKEFDISKFKK